VAEDRQQTLQAIDQKTQKYREHIMGIRDEARANTWAVQEYGLYIQGNTIAPSDGSVEYPRYHAVWADDIRHGIWRERMANIETGPPLEEEINLQKWPPAFDAEEARAHWHAQQLDWQRRSVEAQARMETIEQRLHHLHEVLTRQVQEQGHDITLTQQQTQTHTHGRHHG